MLPSLCGSPPQHDLATRLGQSVLGKSLAVLVGHLGDDVVPLSAKFKDSCPEAEDPELI